MSNSKITTQQFILESKQKFQDKFDYSLTEYINKIANSGTGVINIKYQVLK